MTTRWHCVSFLHQLKLHVHRGHLSFITNRFLDRRECSNRECTIYSLYKLCYKGVWDRKEKEKQEQFSSFYFICDNNVWSCVLICPWWNAYGLPTHRPLLCQTPCCFILLLLPPDAASHTLKAFRVLAMYVYHVWGGVHECAGAGVGAWACVCARKEESGRQYMQMFYGNQVSERVHMLTVAAINELHNEPFLREVQTHVVQTAYSPHYRPKRNYSTDRNWFYA